MARDDRDIKRMRERFVCVRITRMNGVNLRRFQFDYDTTWNAFFLDEKLNVYSRYGGRDDGEPEARMSKESLIQTMRAVLAVHAASRRLSVENRRKLHQPVDAGETTPRDIPLLRKSHQGCVHCHQVREYLYLQWTHDGKFSRDRIYDWPLPENIGLKIDRKHGYRLSGTIEDSLARRAGLQAGDMVVEVNGVPIRSEYDIRWALGRTKKSQPIAISVERTDGKTSKRVSFKLQPTDGWRATDIGWRKSLRSLPLPFGMRGYALTRSQRRELNLSEEDLAVRIVATRDKSLAENLGLKKKDTIVALGKSQSDRSLEQLKSDMLRRYRAGDKVRLTVIRNGKRLVLSGTFPKWRTDETSVP